MITDEHIQQVVTTVQVLKRTIAEQKFVDVGRGAARNLGVSEATLRSALEVLKDEGYVIRLLRTKRKVGMATKQTVLKILTTP